MVGRDYTRSSSVTKGLKANLRTEFWYSIDKEIATNLP